jgi:hypothetical protein
MRKRKREHINDVVENSWEFSSELQVTQIWFRVNVWRKYFRVERKTKWNIKFNVMRNLAVWINVVGGWRKSIWKYKITSTQTPSNGRIKWYNFAIRSKSTNLDIISMVSFQFSRLSPSCNPFSFPFLHWYAFRYVRSVSFFAMTYFWLDYYSFLLLRYYGKHDKFSISFFPEIYHSENDSKHFKIVFLRTWNSLY